MRYASWILLAVLVPAALASWLWSQASAADAGSKPSAAAAAGDSIYAKWKSGPPKDPNWFPLAVWLQEPNLAEQYKAIGINTYVALWEGPTEEQLATLKKAGMLVFVEENEVARKHVDDSLIIGWMHGDEPDNAQDKTGQPIPPDKTIADYKRLKQQDPTRPIMLNLGQAVAWDGWPGRGSRNSHPEDYVEYVKGSDIASFDVYPVSHGMPPIVGKLWKVADGVDRINQWSKGEKLVWNALECTAMDGKGKPTPYQVKAEVWMSLIHGSRGIIYFVHVFKPKSNPAGLLADKEMSDGVGKINKQILELAPALNAPTIKDGATVESSGGKDAPIDLMVKKEGGAVYVFAVAMRDTAAKGSFVVKGLPAKATAEVVGESRKIDVADGKFADDFKGYEVHLYKIAPRK
jgi:hypothetical protein